MASRRPRCHVRERYGVVQRHSGTSTAGKMSGSCMQKIIAGMEMLQLLLCVCYKGVQVPTAVVQGETEANSLIPDSLGIGGCLTAGNSMVWCKRKL